jgi:hypothetical protein
MEKLFKYKYFESTGTRLVKPAGYTRICVHLIFDVKQDGAGRQDVLLVGISLDLTLIKCCLTKKNAYFHLPCRAQ